MDTLGRHLIVDLWECNPDLISTSETLKQLMVEAALHSGADIREVIFHQFEPVGVSGVVVISESHLSVHSFPEHRYVSLDVYTCGGMNPHVSMSFLKDRLGAGRYECIEVIRGDGTLRVESEQPVVLERLDHEHVEPTSPYLF
ncbi:adenosylmethionine decarboxylase [Paenibacillus tarimensis]